MSLKKVALISIFILGLSLIILGLIPSQKTEPRFNRGDPKVLAAAFPDSEQVLVERVVDGDTIEVLSNGGKKTVRYIGVNTPETVDPKRPKECFGEEASSENKQLLAGKTVFMTKDKSETDKFGRLLRFIYLPLDDGQVLFVNDYLVRAGFAKVDTFPPDIAFADRFKQAELEATQNKRGLWHKCRI